MIKKLLIIGWVIGCAAPCIYARETVRLNFLDSVAVNDTVIRLGEIAKIEAESPKLASELSRAIAGEAAPPGYSRFVTGSDLIMYNLKQSFKDIDFKSNIDKRIKVSTAFVQKKIRGFETEINEYIAKHSAWKTGWCMVTIENPDDSWKAYNAPMQVSVGGLESSHARGRVYLELTATQFGKATLIPVRCRLAVTAPVVVAANDISGRELVSRDELRLAETDITNIVAPVFFDPGEATGKRAIGTVPAGTVLTSRMVETPPLIQRGDAITILAISGRARVSVEAIARENGRLGERIWVENSLTHKLIRITVHSRTTGTLL